MMIAGRDSGVWRTFRAQNSLRRPRRLFSWRMAARSDRDLLVPKSGAAVP